MYPVADMLTQIRNTQAVGKETVSFPFSKFKFELSQILKKKNLIEEVIKKGRSPRKLIELTLKYNEDKNPAINELKLISRPSQRIYVTKDKLPRVRQGLGIAIISTSKGLMTDKEARKKKLGGEVICEVW